MLNARDKIEDSCYSKAHNIFVQCQGILLWIKYLFKKCSTLNAFPLNIPKSEAIATLYKTTPEIWTG